MTSNSCFLDSCSLIDYYNRYMQFSKVTETLGIYIDLEGEPNLGRQRKAVFNHGPASACGANNCQCFSKSGFQNGSSGCSNDPFCRRASSFHSAADISG